MEGWTGRRLVAARRLLVKAVLPGLIEAELIAEIHQERVERGATDTKGLRQKCLDVSLVGRAREPIGARGTCRGATDREVLACDTRSRGGHGRPSLWGRGRRLLRQLDACEILRE